MQQKSGHESGMLTNVGASLVKPCGKGLSRIFPNFQKHFVRCAHRTLKVRSRVIGPVMGRKVVV
jgi:hypothetical protein